MRMRHVFLTQTCVRVRRLKWMVLITLCSAVVLLTLTIRQRIMPLSFFESLTSYIHSSHPDINYERKLSHQKYGNSTINGKKISTTKSSMAYYEEYSVNNASWRVLASSLAEDATKNVYIQRLFQAQQLCFRSKPGMANRVFMDTNKSVALCVIPKAGCTFWISILRFINDEMGGQIYESPSQIPRWLIHYANTSSEYHIKNSNNAPEFLNKAFRFMFVRDPYKRLWATWIDKFLLPDYWIETGNIIAKAMGFSANDTRCPVNITFADFLNFITNDYPGNRNEHWVPYHLICDTCVFRPHFIGKMDTFEEDSDFVLANTNLSWAIKVKFEKVSDLNGVRQTKKSIMKSQANTSYFKQNLDTLHVMKININVKQLIIQDKRLKVMNLTKQDEHNFHEMTMLIEYTFDGVLLAFPDIDQCVSRYFVAQRLWLAFQYNGYIPKDHPLQMTHLTPYAWAQVIANAYSKWNANNKKRHQSQNEQKKQAILEGYQKIPLKVMRKIQRLFLHDFLQFGYNPEPDYLFKRPLQGNKLKTPK